MTVSELGSSERLARALEAIGLRDLGARARRDEFHNLRSSERLPQVALAAELRAHNTAAARGLCARVLAGEFIATKAEQDEWQRSPEGRAAFATLREDLAR